MLADAVSASSPALLGLGSSLRTRPPRDTLEAALAVAPGLGISRVTDITRMDRLGLPVCISVRPRGRTLRVHAGKGIAALDARVGAVMEALEFAVAEPQRTAWKRETRRLGELNECWAGAFDLVDLAPHIEKTFDATTSFDVVQCEDLGGGPGQPIPADKIFVPFESPGCPGLLAWSTNGLASGNSVDEATLHALLEILERDAQAMDLASDASRWVAPEEIPEPFGLLAEQWRRIGVELAVRLLPSAFGLPCFEAVLGEPSGSDVLTAVGHGLHLGRDIALARAVTEAAQSRASLIHGGRDDLAAFHARSAGLDATTRRTQTARLVGAKFSRTAFVRYADVPDFPSDGVALDTLLPALLGHLRELGFGQVFRHAFEIDLGGLAVVKVVVPRCENPVHECRHLGRRLLGRVLSNG